ncbi:MAG: ParB/RepB/Spo0J family partition protein [Actinomycetota bacterium]|nr:ParB/RepB/Spo0J family partition protein [Actinomycetota bacterium]MDD5667161.1 ParB/RepB/Spo0J family partition protein [Actinomycetota bacterium]
MAKKGLGKGLGALITTSTAAEQPRHEMIPIDSISPNPMQPRRRFNEESLEELAASLKEHGLVQPIIVRPKGTGYEILVGERRWRAAQLAGAKSIPAVIRDAEASECLQIALVENLHRDDLNGIEEATAFRQLIEDFGLSQDEVAQKVGKSRSAVANSLRLLQLPVEVQATIVAEEITPGHARALLALQGDPYQAALLQRIIEEDLSVRQTEEVARARLVGSGDATQREKPQSLGEYAELISASLGTKVKVMQGKRKGKIIIEFKGEKDLRRLMAELGVGAGGAE